jgi:hypothetical protein
MRFAKLFLGIFFALIWESQCFGYGSIACGVAADATYQCFGSINKLSIAEADGEANAACNKNIGRACDPVARLSDQCVSVAVSLSERQETHKEGRGSTSYAAIAEALSVCRATYMNPQCRTVITLCDGAHEAVGVPVSPYDPKRTFKADLPATQFTSQPRSAKGEVTDVPSRPPPQPSQKEAVDSEDTDLSFLRDPAFWQALRLAKLYENVITGIGLGLGVLIVILFYAKRAAIANFVIHGNLPYTIENRSDDIEVLFKRSQRLNWHGRVIFGLTAQLGMTEQQLLLVRRYRLGRVIAFDSLRRQKQNELAQLHLQLATQVETKAKDDKPLSQLLASLWAVFLIFFWFIRALFSFFFGFLFLRVTIAKLVRGKLIEGFELKLLMEAKTAIEETAIYLKEYLLLAETFDGREEVYEPPA